MSDPFDMVQYASDIAGFTKRMAEAARTGERNWTHPYLNAIFVAFDRASQDPNARIPSALMLAIENARHALGECAPAASPYAERRTQNRNDLELTVDGRHIHPGE